MQPLMVAVKQQIVERNYSAAGKALDELEVLVAPYRPLLQIEGPA